MKIAIVLTLITTPLFAGTSTSANYSTTSEVLDAGGRAASSANYATQSSIGAIGSIGSFGSYTNRGGFPGQLFEATGFQIAFTNPSVNEGTTVSLNAFRTNSDSTRSAVLASLVAWNVVTGPLTSVNASGLAFSAVVYEDTVASVQGTYAGITDVDTVTVLNTSGDNYGMYAADLLPDDWQITHFGLGNPNAIPTADPDSDGQNNRLEYLATTSPTSNASRLKLRLEAVPGNPDARKILFEPYDSKRVYRLFASEDLANPLAWEVISPESEGLAGSEYFMVDHKATSPAKFYRLEIAE